jgi:hypothetical protein
VEFFSVEDLAREEHQRWMTERLAAGWRYGPEMDRFRRRHPDLVSWELLQETSREMNREVVRRSPDVIIRTGNGDLVLLEVKVPGMRSKSSRLARGLTGLAAVLAGPRQAGGYEEWRADLAGSPEEGRLLGFVGQVRYASGFVWAAVRWRVGDVARWAGRRLDWVLVTEERLFTVVTAVVAGAIVRLLIQGGVLEVLHNTENVAALGAGFWGTGYVLRKIRGITPIRRKRPDKHED